MLILGFTWLHYDYPIDMEIRVTKWHDKLINSHEHVNTLIWHDYRNIYSYINW